jgi:hypothetical protein
MADSRAPSGGDLNDPRFRATLSQEDQDYYKYMRENPTLMDTKGASLTEAIGGGTVTTTPLNPFTDPSNAYDKYREGNKLGWDPTGYTGYSDMPYNLGTPTTSTAAARYMNTGGDMAYDANQRALQAQQAQQASLGQLQSAGAQGAVQQGMYAGQQGAMAGKAAGVTAGPVTGQQTLTGQSDYQGYLQQIAQGRSSADAMQAQASMFGSQYQNPDTTAAMMQHRQATDAGLRSNLALARSGLGNQGAAMARAMTSNADVQQNAVAQSAQLQAQQEQSLRGAWMTAQGNANQAYQGLAQQQGQMSGLGSQTYIAAQRANQDAATAEANRYLGAGQGYGAAANTWGQQGSQEMARAQAYQGALQNQYTNAAADRGFGYGMATTQVGLQQQKEQRDYQEWVRQNNVRENMGAQRYATMTGREASNNAAQNAAGMANQQANARGTGTVLQIGSSVMTAGMGLGTAAYQAQQAAQAKQQQNG